MFYGSLTGFFLVYFLMPKFISFMRRKQFGQVIREEGPSHHKKKSGTPTMGGVVIIFSVIVSTLLWCNLRVPFVWLSLFMLISFGLLGFIDDYLKIRRRHNLGLRAREKLAFQAFLSMLFFLMLKKTTGYSFNLYFPFFKHLVICLSWGYLLFAILVILGSSNAMNLTDGLDGLAIVPFCVVAGVYAVFSYVAGHVEFAKYLYIPYVPSAGELAVFCAILVGAGLGFLWYNAHPAEIFMGDVGSLSLGATLGAVSLMIKQELLLPIAGGIFVAEAVSVILQVAYFKATGGKRLFRMAPLHHHFELKGWSETKVVVRFWIISVILGVVAMSTLKIR
jgi:phospho-N-acetylmuramoyl-pentapeptide-transferase